MVICYQADPSQSVVGLARVAHLSGYGRRGRKRLKSGNYFDLDWGCRLEPLRLADMRTDPVLAQMEKARIAQGTVFRISPQELSHLLPMTVPIGTTVADIEKTLGIIWPDSDAPTACTDAELERRVAVVPQARQLRAPRGQDTPGGYNSQRGLRLRA